MTFQTHTAAIKSLPQDAKWSSSFGYPGEGGFTEYYRTSDGRRWSISNGSYLAIEPFTWMVTPIDR